MSVKEFFAFGVIKPKVIDFLKCKGDFTILSSKHKKPFRGHITQYEEEFYACDDFHQIKCFFSNKCKEQFQMRYPSSVKIQQIVNMLICVQEFSLILRQENEILDIGAQSLNKPMSQNSVSRNNKLECILQIDEIQVISFDRFTLKDCPNVTQDEQVKIHLNFVLHFQIKKSLLEDPKYQAVPQITKALISVDILAPKIQQRQYPDQNRNKPMFGQQRFNQRNISSDDEDIQNILKEKLENDDQIGIVQYKKSSEEKKNKQKKPKKLQKLKKSIFIEGFLTCDAHSDIDLIDNLEPEPEPIEVNKPTITHTQKQREDELQKIDDYMEEIVIEEISSSQEAEEESKRSRSIIEMSQNRAPNKEDIPHSIQSFEYINTCSKSYQDELLKTEKFNQKFKQEQLESLEDIIGEEAKNELSEETKKKQFIASQQQNQEILSNPSSALENEKILREHEMTNQKEKIELDFELTEEQQKQENNLMFGSLPTGDIIGFGINHSQKQRKLIESRRQGQGGQNSAKKNQIISSQDDLLDLIDDRTAEEKDQELKKFRQGLAMAPSLPSSGKKEQMKKPTQLTINSMFMKQREDKNNKKQEQKVEKLNKSLNNAQEFKQYNEWAKEHEVKTSESSSHQKGSSVAQVQETKQVGKKRGRPPSKTKQTSK